MDLFLRQSLGIFNGIPPRFMYGDTKKIVKPLLYHEISQLLSIVNFNNDWTLLTDNQFLTDNLNEISLYISDYNGHLYCEKLLEAWFMENMYSASNQYHDIANILGNFNYYSNSIYTYYTNFLDVIAYNISEDYVINNCRNCNNVIRDFANEIKVIELKRDYISDVSIVVNQIKDYMKWANAVLNPRVRVFGYIVATGFNNTYQRVVQNNGNFNIHFLKYQISRGTLNLQEV